MFNRIKTWWKTATFGEKIMTVLNGITTGVSIGTSVYCIRRMGHEFDNTYIHLRIYHPKEMGTVEANEIAICNDEGGARHDLVRDGEPEKEAEE